MKKKNEFKVGQVYKGPHGDKLRIEVIEGNQVEYSYKEEGEHKWSSLRVDSAFSRSLTLIEDIAKKPRSVTPKDRFVIWGAGPSLSRHFPSFESAEAAAIDAIKFESIQSYLILKVVGEVKEQSSTTTTKFE